MKPTLANKPIAYVDVETTGLDPTKHEIIEIAIVFDGERILRADGERWTMGLTFQDDIAIYHTLVRPQHIETAEPKALEINGYAKDPARWSGMPIFSEVAETVARLLEPSTVCAHNVSFDMGFIEAELRRAGVTSRPARHRLDTMSYAHEHLVPCGIESLRLDDICPFLGLSNEGNHRALTDAKRCRAVHKRLQRATVLDRLWWKMRARREHAKKP